MRKVLGFLALAAVLGATFLAVTAPASGAAAFILKNEELGCATEAGDIPGVPPFLLPHGILVITPSGHLTLVCQGELPPGFSFPETLVLPVACNFGPPFGSVTGQIIVTTSGHVTAHCMAQASP